MKWCLVLSGLLSDGIVFSPWRGLGLSGVGPGVRWSGIAGYHIPVFENGVDYLFLGRSFREYPL
jgi:hypothetical protein